jgi:glycosyltransferase involved in cell wall biosynthesis
VEAIESFYWKARIGTKALVKAIAEVDDYRPTDLETMLLARSIGQTLEPQPRIRQVLVDVSVIRRGDLRTGIERVVRSLILALIDALPVGFRVEPVYLAQAGGLWHYRYARNFTLELLGCPAGVLAEDAVDFLAGDTLLGTHLDGATLADADAEGLFARMSDAGVSSYFIVYDLLPILLPHAFPPGGDARHALWLRTITSSHFHGALCISQAVADDLSSWLKVNGPSRPRPFKVGWFELGADTEVSAPTRGLPASAGSILQAIADRPTFLMVGTVEPRKGYAQALGAFEQLWREGVDVNLVIVGSEGWRALPDDMRRTIPVIGALLRNHPERLRRLFWLEDISDEYLQEMYRTSTCLIAASENEGFGLPLIEAAENKLPIIARDIPVFREVAANHAFYFTGSGPGELARTIRQWLALHCQGVAPTSEGIMGKSWAESARQVWDLIHGQQWKRVWPDISSCDSPGSEASSGCPPPEANGHGRLSTAIVGD